MPIPARFLSKVFWDCICWDTRKWFSVRRGPTRANHQPIPPAWQGLYDARGQLVGKIIAPAIVEGLFGAQWVVIAAGTSGIVGWPQAIEWAVPVHQLHMCKCNSVD